VSGAQAGLPYQPTEGAPTQGTKFGPYELLGELGRGAMGVVYRARQPDLNRFVALKTINPQLIDAEMSQRFVREGQAAAKLGKHPNIVQVYDAGVIGETPFIAMELVEGTSLDVHVKRDGPIPVGKMLEVARKVALALDHAHRRGIIHRDMKPGNVVIDRDGEPQLLDFGLAKDVTSQSMLSTDGSIIGTPAYMPPEQAQPGSAPVDRRSDVYSLGALMHHALSGEPPFSGDSMVATIVKVLTQDPPPLSRLAGVPRDVEAIIDKAMEKQQKRRYQTALELADDLSRVIAGDPPRARPLNAVGRTWRRVRRSRGAILGLSVLLCVFVLATGYLLWRTWERGRAILQRNRATQLLGTLYLNEGATFKIELFERARQIDPSWGHAYFQLAVACTDRGLELDGTDPEAGRAMRLRAIEVLHEGIASGLGVQGVYQLANTYEELLDYPNALAHFERAARLDPGGSFGLRAACAAAYLEGRFRDAVELGGQALDLASDDDLTYWRRGSSLLAMGDWEGAARDGVRAVELWEIEPEYHLLAAEGFLGLGDLRRSGAYLLSAHEINPRHPVVTAILSGRALRDGDAARALALAQRAMADDDREPQVWTARAGARLAQGDREGARADLAEALSRHEHNEDAQAMLAALDAGAEALLEAAEDAGELTELARSAFARGQWGLAEQAVSRALGASAAEDDAATAAIRGALAEVRLARGDAAGALAALEGGDADAAELEAWRAQVYRQLGRDADMLASAERALAGGEQPARALRARARARMSAGETELALVDVERVLRRDPLDVESRRIRMSCRRALRDDDGARVDAAVLAWLSP
jgi:tetratricopeptide (TPR) repeat protein/predicted Ser/Thr protein kinase